MAVNIAIAAQGTKLQRGDGGGPEVFATIADEIEVNAPGLERDDVDVTHAESPSNYQEFIMSGIKKLTEFAITINYKPTEATHNAAAGVIKDQVDGALKNYKLLFPDGSFWIFPTFVKRFQPLPPAKEQLRAQITFRPSGAPTLT